ncbi:MAG: PorP/SprF family type IX secretion system membrane protein [Ferruginibacter sp.]|nr:PorP/SprF family type IX secretion system membrane protein [Ferruginibacter sp.]
MKNIVKTLIIGLACMQVQLLVQAQDLHFSQFFNSPLTTNPANTGFIPDADYRIGAHYRNQYSNILASPYKTISVFGDAQLLRNQIDNGWLGLGGLILSDVAGSGGLRSTKIYGSLAYHQQLGNSSLLTAGFNVGWANKRIDQSKLSFPDQFDGKFFDNTLPSSVVLTNNNVSYLDVQVGLNYAYFPTEDIYVNGGYSIHHVNRPQETFFTGSPDSSRIPMRHIGFINALLKINDRVIINPNIYYTTQAKSAEFVLGLNANYNLSGEGGEKQLLAGLYYRAGDAVIPMVGFEIKNIRFTFSYDVTTSGLRTFNNFQGANEFNLIKKGFYSENTGDVRQVFCPQF